MSYGMSYELYDMYIVSIVCILLCHRDYCITINYVSFTIPSIDPHHIGKE